MSKLDTYFADYAAFHRTPGNWRTHAVGIPMIVTAVLSWASHWVWFQTHATQLPASLVQVDFACLIILLATGWYCLLDWKLGLPFLPVLYGLYWIGRALPNEAAWAFFILGWILQLVGHAFFEKKSPAFTKNVEHLLIGPLWVFVKILHLEVGSTNPSRS